MVFIPRRGKTFIFHSSRRSIQELLGHENASTTLDIYTHLSLEGKKDTALVLDKILMGKAEG